MYCCVKPYFHISQLCEFVVRQENIVAYIRILGTGSNSCHWLRVPVCIVECHLENVYVWVCRMGVLSSFGCKLVVLVNKNG